MKRGDIKEQLWLTAVNDGDAYRDRAATIAVDRAILFFFKQVCDCGACATACLGLRAILILDLLDRWQEWEAQA